MMGRQKVDQSQLFYLFNLEGRIPAHHLLRRINPVVTGHLAVAGDAARYFGSEKHNRKCLSFLVVLALLDRQYPDKE
jgi:hypothetical protein